MAIDRGTVPANPGFQTRRRNYAVQSRVGTEHCFRFRVGLNGRRTDIQRHDAAFALFVRGDFAISQRKGELASNVPNGYGFDLTGMFKIDPAGYFNIRADVGDLMRGLLAAA